MSEVTSKVTPKVVVMAAPKRTIPTAPPKFTTVVEHAPEPKSSIVPVSAQTLLEMEAGREALKRAANGR